MHNIDGPGHQGGRFVHEDPATGRPPTQVTADWLNAVQEELVAAIAAGGLALEKSNNGQLAAAIEALFAAHGAAANPHPQYTTEPEVRGLMSEAAPPGAVMYFSMTTAPPGWLKANGAAVSRAAYSALFAAIGTTFGAGDGSTTFNLPDLRGEFLRGFDDGRGVDGGRRFGTSQSGQNASHEHAWGIWTSRPVEDPASSFSPNGVVLKQISGSTIDFDNYQITDTASLTGSGNIIRGVTSGTGGVESRPRNVALLACIKY